MDKARKTTKTKFTKGPQVPSLMHSGIWEIVFSYAGTPKEIYSFRKVNRAWKKAFKKYMDSFIRSKKKQLENLKNNTKNITESIPSDIKEEVEEAIRLKNKYSERLREVRSSRIQHMGFFVNPPVILFLPYSAVINFILTAKQLKDLGWKHIDWVKCKNMIIKIDFLKKLYKITPESIT